MTAEHIDLATDWRRHLHAIPGIAFDVAEVAEFVARTCTDLGWEVTTGIGGSGVVATLRRGTSSRSIALRADMDGLPITENTGVAHASKNPGSMHACGHDGHMAMLLGTASALAKDIDFDGTVHLIFQPAEEPGTGAEAMINDRLFDRFPTDEIYGLHNIPGLPEGEIHTRPGPIMASEDNFEIRISGRGGHASAPHFVIDPMIVGAEIVLSLQTVVARNVDPLDAVVVSCTELFTDGARNAIPGQLVIRGDARTFTDADSTLVETRIREISEGIAVAHRASCEVSYTRVFRPTVNDADCVGHASAAARRAVGSDKVDASCRPVTASEDFAAYAREVPACFAFLGAGEIGEGGTAPLHSRDFDFNDRILGAGIEFYTALVTARLTEGNHS
ncbi:M20 aminoacylase family protein [Brevibacterium spongiae]|uniref:M20 family metallopeptidase n=1 Tax=Brevibacterium spongiae TaxID=2909672 RepID=A0ABY5SP59_9MICO|nr:M20 aminoacylase family protein [Brevibacterium spongiae]UVI36362.1 M20 family metallopeptidase [Brevibacterium spongiae]